MKFMTKGAVLLMPMFALATPALAAPPATLNNSNQPGSAIVFPKFVNLPQVTVNGNLVSRSEIEIGVVCPAGLICPVGTNVNVQFRWVCPGAEDVNSNICPEADFEITTLTVNGKRAFSADGIPINAASPTVPPAPCPRGYLIGWVETADGQPVKFDALIGNAVIRGQALTAGPEAGSSTAVSAYNAIPIQANTVDPYPYPGGVVPVSGPTAPELMLAFDGGSGHYQQLTQWQVGDVRFDKTAPGGPPPDVFSVTALIFLTLDVTSGQPNNPVFLPLAFYNEDEVVTSFEGYEFVCWDQPALSFLAGGSLTQLQQGTRKGIVLAGPATKLGGIPGPATLIGLVETNEGTAANGFTERKYNFNMVSPFVP